MERFEVKGKWWFPGEEKEDEKLDGMLVFEPSVSGRLIVGDRFFYRWIQDRHRPEGVFSVVLGETNDGTPITLYNCRPAHVWQGSRNNELEQDNGWLFADVIIVGHHFANPEEIVFQEISTRYTHLDQWVVWWSQAEHEEDLERIFTREHSDESTLQYRPILEPIRLQIDDEQVVIYHDDDHTAATDLGPNRIAIKLVGNRHISRYRRFLDIYIRHFLSLATSRPNFPTDVKGHVSNGGVRQDLSIFFSTKGYKTVDETPVSFEMLFRMRDVQHDLTQYLSKWIRDYDKYESVHQVFFSTYSLDWSTDIVITFLLLTQALEAYHRELYPEKGKYEDDDNYKHIKANITSFLSTNVENDSLRKKLVNSLELGNDFTFARRVKSVCKDILREYYKDIFDSQPKLKYRSFEFRVPKTRNFYTHRLKEREHVISPEQMGTYVEKLSLIVQFLLLIYLELPKETIGELLLPYKRRYISEL